MTAVFFDFICRRPIACTTFSTCTQLPESGMAHSGIGISSSWSDDIDNLARKVRASSFWFRRDARGAEAPDAGHAHTIDAPGTEVLRDRDLLTARLVYQKTQHVLPVFFRQLLAWSSSAHKHYSPHQLGVLLIEFSDLAQLVWKTAIIFLRHYGKTACFASETMMDPPFQRPGAAVSWRAVAKLPFARKLVAVFDGDSATDCNGRKIVLYHYQKLIL